jgi:glycosyltransferase involved in cell wall biosynthesis
VHGLLFTPAAWDELAERLYTLLSDAALRDALGRAGQRKVAGEFEINKAVQPLVSRWLT